MSKKTSQNWEDEPVSISNLVLKDDENGGKESLAKTSEISSLKNAVNDKEEHEVQVVLADSSELYHSVTSFEDLGLKPELLKGGILL
jgi:hypothetical protein